MLNNIGASTLPCGSQFRCRRQQLFFPFSTAVGRGVLSVVCSVLFRYVGSDVPLGSQWCCSAALACIGRHKACVSWTTPSCCCGSCLLVCHALRRSSERTLISSSSSMMVLSAKGSSSYFSRYSSISSMDSGVRPGHSSSYTHEGCSIGRLFVRAFTNWSYHSAVAGMFSTAASS